jgi:hypothetical protein
VQDGVGDFEREVINDEVAKARTTRGRKRDKGGKGELLERRKEGVMHPGRQDCARVEEALEVLVVCCNFENFDDRKELLTG